MIALFACLSLALTAAPATLGVPLDDAKDWVHLTYRNIRPNRVEFGHEGMSIIVDQSSSPLIYKFEQPFRLAGLAVEGSWRGQLKIPDGKTQGETSADDFVIKLGIVVAGDKRLNWFQKRVAAPWILSLYELAPEGSGISSIRFYSTTQQAELLGTSRTHPLSNLIYEERVLYLDSPGPFKLVTSFDEPTEAVALWISSDGDDTGSAFQVSIDGITLRIADE
jgi:hypothetical protein